LDKKDVVAGLGEIGTPILQTISKGAPAIGYDLNPKLMNEKKYKKYEKLQTCLLHI
jgi:UDP-N-acetyl-D-mannosaminuronate dehydrogenase